MRKIGFNSQRNNFDFGGKFRGGQQCFSTSAWMFMSFYAPKINATDDNVLKLYVDDVCNIVGQAGIGEEAAKTNGIPTGQNSAYWWTVQAAGIEKWLHLAAVQGNTIFRDGCSWEEFEAAIKAGPVIIGTNKLGGLSGGHIILVVDYDGQFLYCNDPYGDAMTNYQKTNGENVAYKKEWIKPFIGGDKLRCIWWKDGKNN